MVERTGLAIETFPWKSLVVWFYCKSRVEPEWLNSVSFGINPVLFTTLTNWLCRVCHPCHTRYLLS